MIATWSVGAALDHMAVGILTEHAELVRRHPWWQARAKLTLGLLDRLGIRPPARVLDVGCGWGVTLVALEESRFPAVGMDISRPALEMLDRERRDRYLIEADLAQPLPADPAAYEAVLALDVLEHMDDDRVAVERLGQLAAPDGVVVVSVPALPEMFSEFDAIQGHRRRYLPETLRRAFAGTNLEVDRVFWWGAWLVPMLRRQRRRPLRAAPDESVSEIYGRYLRLPPWSAPWAMRAAFAWEHGRALAGNLTIGTSLFAVARRTASS